MAICATTGSMIEQIAVFEVISVSMDAAKLRQDTVTTGGTPRNSKSSSAIIFERPLIETCENT